MQSAAASASCPSTGASGPCEASVHIVTADCSNMYKVLCGICPEAVRTLAAAKRLSPPLSKARRNLICDGVGEPCRTVCEAGMSIPARQNLQGEGKLVPRPIRGQSPDPWELFQLSNTGVLHIRSSPFVRLALLRSLPQRRRIMPEKGPAKPFSAPWRLTWAGRSYNPFSSSGSVVSRAEAILPRVRSPGSRAPRSKSEICTSWTPDCSARSICRQFRARRNFRIRSPVAAQMSFAMRSSSG